MRVSDLTFDRSTHGKEAHVLFTALILLFLAGELAAQQAKAGPNIQLQLDPAKSSAEITLVGNMHTVEGSFQAVRGTIHFNSVTGSAGGEIVFDARTGKTGNDSRDKKMHNDVLESTRFAEISFRPDRAEGTLAGAGDSTLQVHGQFVIHGAEHEVVFPVQVHLEGETWTANSTFTVPYAKWGMKNPSVLFLRVAGEVKVQFHASGSLAEIHSP